MPARTVDPESSGRTKRKTSRKWETKARKREKRRRRMEKPLEGKADQSR